MELTNDKVKSPNKRYNLDNTPDHVMDGYRKLWPDLSDFDIITQLNKPILSKEEVDLLLFNIENNLFFDDYFIDNKFPEEILADLRKRHDWLIEELNRVRREIKDIESGNYIDKWIETHEDYKRKCVVDWLYTDVDLIEKFVSGLKSQSVSDIRRRLKIEALEELIKIKKGEE